MSTKKLLDRIAALEDALQISTSGNHPLLKQDLSETKIESTPELVDADSPSNSTDSAEDEISDAFGTLSIGRGKSLRFLGSSAVEVRQDINFTQNELF